MNTSTLETGVLKWNATREEHQLILKIVERAERFAATHNLPLDSRHTSLMDVEACHCNGMPLDLERFLQFKDGDFGHDFWGIRRHLNRRNGQLMDCFTPRCALYQGGSL